MGSKDGARAASCAPLIEGLTSRFVNIVPDDAAMARAAFALVHDLFEFFVQAYGKHQRMVMELLVGMSGQYEVWIID
uniref:Uncharacterized protein n=1 Tax=Romanomermis culicivorax TaxID=13658 RepID=A0A915JL03_ROMCU